MARKLLIYRLNTPFMKSTTKEGFVMSLMLFERQLERPNLISAEREWSKRPSVTWTLRLPTSWASSVLSRM